MWESERRTWPDERVPVVGYWNGGEDIGWCVLIGDAWYSARSCGAPLNRWPDPDYWIHPPTRQGSAATDTPTSKE